MKSLRTLLLGIFVAASTVVALAQGGGMRMMGGQGGGSPLMLLQRNDVKKDLALTDDQISKLESLQQKMMEEMRSMFQGGGGGGDREAMRKKMTEMMTAMEKEANGILDAKQQGRLKEIHLQFLGNRAISTPAYQKELKVTETQLAKIKELNDKSREAMSTIREKMQSGEITREEFMEIMKKNNDTMDKELGKLMTDEQKALLTKMQGRKFERDPDEGGGN
jgi:Spy/CpxP family protein refolding chaperone